MSCFPSLGLFARRIAAGAAVLAVAGQAPAMAQLLTDQSVQSIPHEQPNAPIPRVAPAKVIGSAQNAWPRLDPGAVFCNTQADLERRAKAIAATLEGDQSGAPDNAGCSIVRAPTPIDVINRHGQGETEVRMKQGTTATGWTDAWLPVRR